jgi:glycosyltransferase involved in cell wall biosynthesis
MRVLYVNQTSQVSGAEHSLLTLLNGIRGEVEQLVATPAGELTDELDAADFNWAPIRGTVASFRPHPVHTTKGLADIGFSALQVRRLVAAAKPDLVYANTTRASLLALLARDRSGPPTIAHIRDRAPDGRFSRAVFELIGHRADAVVATSHYVADQFDEIELRRPVEVIYDPIDLAHFDPEKVDGPATRRALGLSEDTVVFSLVAQITPLKGQDTAIRAVAELAAEGLDVALLLVGSVKFASPGTQLDNVAFGSELHDLTAQLEAGNVVHFLGERSDVPDLIAASDLVLMPFWRDAFGRVSPEAMSLGVPVVASEVGGPAETVRDGIDGVLLPPRDPSAWARTLGELARDRERRRELAQNALRRAQDFSVDSHVGEMLALYRRLAGS